MRRGPLLQPEASTPLGLSSVPSRGLSTVDTAVPLSLNTRVVLTTNDKPEISEGALMVEKLSLGTVLGQAAVVCVGGGVGGQ